MELEKKVTEILARLGIPRNVKGFGYLRKAIMLSVHDRTFIENITKLLYPTIALEHKGETPNRAERAMRHAIELACGNNPAGMERIFHRQISVISDKPCNGEFIATIADDVRLGVL